MGQTNKNTHLEERRQSLVRIGLTSLCLLTIAGSMLISRESERDAGAIRNALGLVTGYLGFAVAWFYWVRATVGKLQGRRWLTLATDIAIVTVSFDAIGSLSPFFYSVYLWIIIGNGLRFGVPFLVGGALMSCAGLAHLMGSNPFWIEHRTLGMGLVVGLIMLPLAYLKNMQRIQELQGRLERQLERSRAAELAKGEFLANMSHEIRTPMNGILGMAEVLGDSDLDDSQQEQLEIITRSADSLLTIINDILDYSKISSGKLTLEVVPFNLKQILQDVIQLLKSSATEKGLALEFDYLPGASTAFVGDPTRVRQIAFNLLGNAIKFTEQGEVRLICRADLEAGRGNVSLTIRDTGVGIPEDRLEAIFDQFEQADNSTTRLYGGTGLGLAISRQLAVLMGGEIMVRSEVGVGSEFQADITLAMSSAEVASAPAVAHQRNFGLRVLVAEDNRMNQVVAGKLMRKLGFDPVMADDAELALDALQTGDFDLVFMDVRMPGMNGLEATRLIRGGGYGRPDIPVIALTADASPEDAAACLAAGMNAYLTKPLRTVEMVEAVDSLVLPTPV